ncbi:colicin [Salmonella enterica subsp. houtenae]|nr:colicin [Salmonella enterica subsp. houtenae]ECJ2525322.1 lipid II-degrading bacteriocin [Salmonella enterica subsp. houtenae]
MTDTITVVAPVPPSGSALAGNYSASTMSAGNRISSGPTFLQFAYPYYQSPQLAVNCAKWILDFVESHDMKNANNQQIFSENVGQFCFADKNLVDYPTMKVLDAFGGDRKFIYSQDQISRLSGDVTTPITAWAHFLWGDGAARTVNLTDVGLRIQPNQISPVMDLVKGGAVGTFPVNAKFTRDTMLDGIIPASYLGNITLQTTGTLTINSLGAWSHDGVVKAYNDTYDANPSTHRGLLGEYSTSVLRHFSGTPYEIQMPGMIPVKGNGMR